MYISNILLRYFRINYILYNNNIHINILLIYIYLILYNNITIMNYNTNL